MKNNIDVFYFSCVDSVSVSACKHIISMSVGGSEEQHRRVLLQLRGAHPRTAYGRWGDGEASVPGDVEGHPGSERGSV